jgi:cell wall assembly regulator SMI1
MNAITLAWRQIEAAQREHLPAALKALGRPATEGQVARLERMIGRPLPEALIASLRVHNGMHDQGRRATLFDNQFLLSTAGIAEKWQKLRSLRTGRYSERGGCPLTKTRKIRNDRWWNLAWVPITEDEGDGFVVDLDPAGRGKVGQVFYFYYDGFRPREVVAASYGDWLQKLAKAFARRQFTIEQGSVWLQAGF